jgi:N-acetylglucosaminyldiphosphoundecaprenol N-acetyl-beta-D-mannosaminyltransferase
MQTCLKRALARSEGPRDSAASAPQRASRPARVAILGVPVDNITLEQAAERVAGFLSAGGAHHVVTVNPEFVMEARHNAPFRRALLRADLATVDGFGLLLAARWQRTPLAGRVTGVALTERIAALCAAEGRSIFFLGAAPGVAERAAEALRRQFPGLRVAGCFAGTPQPRHEPFLRQLIAAARPHVLLVAYGHPAQDLWIARNQPSLQIPVAIGVGGTFDELAGVVPRAPRWMQRLGLKWLFRLLTQPRRWRRMLVAVPGFMWAVATHRDGADDAGAAGE